MMRKIEGYCASTSFIAGHVASFHISSDPGPFTYVLYRMGVTDIALASGAGVAAAHPTADNASSHGCGWPVSLQLTIPPTFRSGVYLLELDNGSSTYEISFVVRSAMPGGTSRMLVMIPVTTSQAYNEWGGHSLYAISAEAVTQVSFDRPCSVMAGTWGPGTTRMGGYGPQWEEKFIRWLEAHYVAEYCTSIDLHEEPGLLSAYQLLVSVGHDEYWSREMRDHTEAFVASGGNLAFFSGNVCYWQVRFENGNRTMVCYKGNSDPLHDTYLATDRWDSLRVGRPENTLTGVGTKHGAVGDMMSYPAVNYHVHVSEHWVFASTGLGNGEAFGSYTDAENRIRSIVGYETDAADFVLDGGVPVATGSDGTPRGFIVLASADLGSFTGQPGRATLGLFYNRGIVFTAATTNWVYGLAEIPVVQQITRNVLSRLSLSNAASPPLRNGDFHTLDGWIQERPGEYRPLTDAGMPPATRTTAALAASALAIDATDEPTWVSQLLEPLHGHTFYRVSCWVKASVPGALVALQDTSDWADVAVAEHSGSDQWQLLSAIAKVDNKGPVFQARVRLQASQGVALFARVAVEVP